MGDGARGRRDVVTVLLRGHRAVLERILRLGIASADRQRSGGDAEECDAADDETSLHLHETS